MAKPTPPIDKLTLEQAMDELQSIISAMENETANLQETLLMFERGKELIAYCQKLLDSAELKVRTLGETPDSAPDTED